MVTGATRVEKWIKNKGNSVPKDINYVTQQYYHGKKKNTLNITYSTMNNVIYNNFEDINKIKLFGTRSHIQDNTSRKLIFNYGSLSNIHVINSPSLGHLDQQCFDMIL
jgi:hypothetical protein